ncbi:SMP-30/gluconolactonase/LRE family protein [Streptomyces sp. AP-93]|uniref:SMP-30/gluconolactonase/LRE family protein n=1 Tax=Streptomyces sp. AP-93 TaxID=2929048 RepID=UPI001FAF45F4|nr:superoxide dismutase [Streptomyces sp. AP-93]MCJ0869503.1 superoxide dismutase [Streptomyces sp. AP-93]
MTGSIGRRGFIGAAAALGGAALVGAGAPLAQAQGAQAQQAAWLPRPDTVAIPAGFQPEGIAVSAHGTAYTGSLLDGSVYRFELATGAGRIITRGEGPMSVGLKLDPYGRLLVAGGASGQIRVVDARDGRVLATHQAATGTAFVNDAVVGCGGAWFTDSFADVLYFLPVGRDLTGPGAVPRALRLGGEWDPVPPGGAYWGANGIERTPDGRALLVVHDTAEALFRVDPRTGAATRTVLDGGSVGNGDGLVLHGRTLYVVRNWAYAVDVFTLSGDGRRARFVKRITDPRFDEPTTAAVYGGRLYVVNARFDADWSDPATASTVVSCPL